MEWLLGIALVILAGIGLALRNAPLVDESRCQRRHLLRAGECQGPCQPGKTQPCAPR